MTSKERNNPPFDESVKETSQLYELLKATVVL